MSDNRVIIKLKRVPSLSDPSIDKIQDGENFINEADNGLYWKDLNGKVVGLTNIKPSNASDAVLTEDGGTQIELTENGGLTLTPFQFIIRYISPVTNINDKLTFKGIDGDFRITDIYGKTINKGEIKKDMLVQLLYVGDNTFRLMSGGGISTDADGNIILGSDTIIQGGLTVEGPITGIKEEDIAEIVRKIVGDGMAIGTIVTFMKGPLPKGFLRLNGNKFSRDLYPALFDYLGTDILPDASDLYFKGVGNTIQAGEIKNAYINMPVYIKGNENAIDGFLSPVVVEASGEDYYNVNGMNVSGDGTTSDSVDLAPKSMGVIWAIKAGSSYVNESEIDLNHIMDKLDDTYRISEVDRKFVPFANLQSKLGSKSTTDVPNMRLLDDLKIPDLKAGLAKEVENRTKLETSKSDAIIGEIRLLPFRSSDLPKGWYLASGDKYDTSSDIGMALIKLPFNYKKDWKIVEAEGKINTPNFFHEDGRGFFFRAGKNPAVVQEDAIRNIIGRFGDVRASHSNNGAAIFKTTTGVFSSTPGIRNMIGDVNTINNMQPDSPYVVDFDASKVVPTANENRPVNITLVPAIYLGI
ncbi:phage tail protein [Proteus mirabilis]|uniref:phage tail protein n=1 Tax=Proteus mirabilis TaxID=584 RepID=UPI0034D6F345